MDLHTKRTAWVQKEAAYLLSGGLQNMPEQAGYFLLVACITPSCTVTQNSMKEKHINKPTYNDF